MWRMPFLAVAALLVAAPASLAARFNCAVDDDNVKLTLDVGFEEKGAHKVNHFRGALIAKQEAVPAGFRQLMFDSTQLAHNWGYDNDLRLDIYAEGLNEDAGTNFDLIVMASRKAQGGPLPGNYILTFDGQGAAKPLQFKGSLTCSAK
jgi:hypothetical protein